MTRMFSRLASITVMFDSLMQPVISLLNSSLAVVRTNYLTAQP